MYDVPAVAAAVSVVVITPFTVVRDAAPSVPNVADIAATAQLTGTPAAVTTSTRIVAVPVPFTIPTPP